MPGIFDALTKLLPGGSIIDKAIDLAKDYFPPEASKEKVMEFQLRAQQLGWEHEKSVAAAMAEAEKSLNERIAQTEGTASDLKSMPILGPVMLFARGSQRPIWGFATLYMDYQVFSGAWTLGDPQVSGAFYVLNFLVGGFLFGERAIMNVAPMIKDIISAKKA